MALAMIKHDGRIGITNPIQRHGAIHVGVIRPDDMTRRHFDHILCLIRQTACYSIAVNTKGRPACYEDPVLKPADDALA